jgi:trehalose transport system substrate-binding protein
MKRNTTLFIYLFCLMLMLSIFLVGSDRFYNEKADTLTVAIGLGKTEFEVFHNIIIPAFKKETGIEVKTIELKQEQLINYLNRQTSMEKPKIDMFTQDLNNLYNLVSLDLVENLTEYDTIIPDNVLPSMKRAGQYEGNQYFLPYRPNVEIVFFNKKQFDRINMKVPESWEELLAVAKTFYHEDGQGRVAIKANLKIDNVLNMIDFVNAAGGDPYSLADEGSIQAFTFMQELYPYLNKKSSMADWSIMNTLLEENEIYLGNNWPFYIPTFYKKGKFEIQAYSGWSGPEKESHTLGGEVIGIPKGSKKTDQAILFAEYLMSKPVQELLVNQLSWPSLLTDGYGLIQDYQKPYTGAIQNALQKAEPIGIVPYWIEMKKIYIKAFEKAVINKEDVNLTLEEASEELERVKQNYDE